MPIVTVSYGAKTRTVDVVSGAGLGEAIAATELPLEQPCAGRGTCGKCRVLIEGEQSGSGQQLSALDEVEQQLLSPAEQISPSRLRIRSLMGLSTTSPSSTSGITEQIPICSIV